MISFLAIKRLDRTVPEKWLEFSILYDSYDSKHYWWWEIIIQLQKFSVIFISAFIESCEQQILLVLFVVVVSLFFTASLRPFYNGCLVRMEMLSLICIYWKLWATNIISVVCCCCIFYYRWCYRHINTTSMRCHKHLWCIAKSKLCFWIDQLWRQV